MSRQVSVSKKFELLVPVCVIFIYSSLAQYALREWGLPLVTSHVHEGTLGGDPCYYHLLALEWAENIRSFGMEYWELRPHGQGLVGIMSLVYLFSTDQWTIVLLNSSLHTISSIFLVLILREWFSVRIALTASLPFILSAYQMHWFSQLNKDSYVAAGAMLLIYGVVLGAKYIIYRAEFSGMVRSILATIAGGLLLSLVRPYLIDILRYSVVLVVLFALIYRLAFRSKSLSIVQVCFVVLWLVLVGLSGPLTSGAASDQTLRAVASAPEHGTDMDQLTLYPVALDCFQKTTEQWEVNGLLPISIDSRLRALMTQRCLFFIQLYDDSPATRSAVKDSSWLPISAVKVLMYSPKALANALFAPFAGRWFVSSSQSISIFFLAATVESLVFYVAFVGLLLLLVRGRDYILIWCVLIISLTALLAYGLGVPFLGALYRYRYPFWMLLLSIGLAGWLQALLSRPTIGAGVSKSAVS